MYYAYVKSETSEQLHATVNTVYNKHGSNLIKYEDRVDGHLKNSPSCKIPSKLFDLREFYNYGRLHLKANCVNIAEIGGSKRANGNQYPYNSGSRIVCFDEVKKNDCFVLSFGIGRDYSFENDIEFISSCKVYMFDPAMGLKDHRRPPNIYFYNLGLSDKKGKIQIGTHSSNVDRYEGILQLLNLTDHAIDYLKIDIEGSELAFFRDVLETSSHLLANVKQIGMGIHPILTKNKSEKGRANLVDAFQSYWEAMHRLECLGFDLTAFVPNLAKNCSFHYMGQEVAGCFDIVFAKKIENVLGV